MVQTPREYTGQLSASTLAGSRLQHHGLLVSLYNSVSSLCNPGHPGPRDLRVNRTTLPTRTTSQSIRIPRAFVPNRLGQISDDVVYELKGGTGV